MLGKKFTKLICCSFIIGTFAIQADEITVSITDDVPVDFYENQSPKIIKFQHNSSVRFTKLNVPAGALSSEHRLWYTKFSDVDNGPDSPSEPDGYANISFDFHFNNPSFHLWDEPVTVVVKYTDSDISGLDEATLKLVFYDTVSDTWKSALDPSCGSGTITRTPSTNQISLPICHFTQYALAGSE